MSGPDPGQAAVGEAVLERAVISARTAFGRRLAAAYAVGSLAHGGFCVAASDIDLALVLNAPWAREDSDRVASLVGRVRASGVPLAERLSVFWGVLEPDGLGGGRLPAVDRLDLVESGRLLAGIDARDRISRPSRRRLDIESAQFALDRLGSAAHTADLLRPSRLAERGAIAATKAVLFPVRLLYTLDTGRPGFNDLAADTYLARASGARRELVASAVAVRHGQAEMQDLAGERLAQALVPLHIELAEALHRRMAEHGESALADEVALWHHDLRSFPS